MNLYRKQLRSVADLKLEKSRLKQQCARMEQEAMTDLKSMKVPDILPDFKNTGDNDGGASGIASLLGGLMPGAGPALKIFESVVQGLGGNLTGKIKKRATGLAAGAAKEVIGGYLKWKAVELGFKGIRYLLQNRKKKKKAAAASKTTA